MRPTRAHFHIDLRTPPIRPLPNQLLADNAVFDQTSSAVNDALRVAAQSLSEAIQPRLAFDQGDLTMFVMDVPPDVPPQYAPIVVAEATQAKKQTLDRTIGVCHLVDSRPEARLSAVNALLPAKAAWGYLKYQEHQPIEETARLTAKMTLLQAPKHGELPLFESTQSGRYLVSEPNFEGSDQATVLVEIGDYKVKVIYFFKVMRYVPSGTQSNPYTKENCPQDTRVWKISFDESDPTAPIYTFEHPTQLTSAVAGVVNANLTFADLAGGACRAQ